MRQVTGFVGRLGPGEEPVVFPQAFALAPVQATSLMQAKETAHPAQEQQRNQDEVAEAAVGDDQIARFEVVEQFIEQGQFMLVLVAFGVIEQDAAAQTEDGHHLQERKTTARLLGAGLGISPLVFGRVGQTQSAAVDDFGAQAMPELLELRQEFIGASRDRMANALEGVQRQAPAGLTITAGAFIDGAVVMETESLRSNLSAILV